MAKRYYWLKLKEDFFRQRQIKKLRRIAGGDTYTVIYLKMLLLAMQSDGRIALDGQDFAEELALELDEETDNVKITASYLLNCGLMEKINDNEVFIPEAVANVGSESSSAERMRKSREKNGGKLSQCDAKTSQCDALPSLCAKNVTPEIEIEKEIEIRDRERDIYMSADASVVLTDNDRTACSIPYSKIQSLFNSLCPSLPRIIRISEPRKKAIAARWREYDKDIEIFKRLFEIAENSAFLKGSNNTNWTANFDWLMKSANMAKVLEGNYNDRHAPKKEQHVETQAEYEERLRTQGEFQGYVDFHKMFPD